MKLQMRAIDVVYAYKQVEKVISTLRSLRSDSVTEFRKQFSEALRIGRQLHGDTFQLTSPRFAKQQQHRSNPPSSTPEEYYRITLYEFLSLILSELEERFLNNPSHGVAVGLLHLLPSACIDLAKDVTVRKDLVAAVDQFINDLPSPVMFTTEYGLWVRQRKGWSGDVPRTLMGTLREFSALAYPNLHVLLKLAVVLSVTSCESERSFSQLQLIKTARHSTMTESRLGSLALMKINRDRCNELLSEDNMKRLVQAFTQQHPRRMKLLFILPNED